MNWKRRWELSDIQVGPIGNSYFYRIGQYLSEPYANYQSAWRASRRQQTLKDKVLIPFD